jgi:hypothetical protein
MRSIPHPTRVSITYPALLSLSTAVTVDVSNNECIQFITLLKGLDFKCEVDRRCNQVLGMPCCAVLCCTLLLLLMLILPFLAISTAATRCAQLNSFPSDSASAEQCFHEKNNVFTVRITFK